MKRLCIYSCNLTFRGCCLMWFHRAELCVVTFGTWCVGMGFTVYMAFQWCSESSTIQYPYTPLPTLRDQLYSYQFTQGNSACYFSKNKCSTLGYEWSKWMLENGELFSPFEVCLKQTNWWLRCSLINLCGHIPCLHVNFISFLSFQLVKLFKDTKQVIIWNP